ncbi:MAG: PIG-L family deacetylase [Anaerolineae bacterium]|nr:PIG-L family deacetylase [Anaerolineae bacterium]
MTTTSAYRHIYLSPHIDDAALSCGGAIYQQTQANESVLVLTIFAADPPRKTPISSYAQRMHDSWGNFESMVATRRAEDRASMAVLGVDYRHLNFVDCIYRGEPEQGRWYYLNNTQLFGQVHPDDAHLAQALVSTITGIVEPGDETVLYAPLTVGNHIDHQLTHRAALDLGQQGWMVVFYEDYPYTDPGYPLSTTTVKEESRYSLANTLAAKTDLGLRPELRYLTEEAIAAKIESIAAYASQMQMLFGGEAAMANHVRAYALRVGEGQLAERIWRFG